MYRQQIHDVHDRAINGVVVGQRPVPIDVANTAPVSEPPLPCTTTVRAVRVPVRARRVTHSAPQAVVVDAGAPLFVTELGRRHIDGHHRITPLPK